MDVPEEGEPQWEGMDLVGEGESGSLMQRYSDWGFTPEADGEGGDYAMDQHEEDEDDDAARHQVVLAPIHEHRSSFDPPPQARNKGLGAAGDGGGGGCESPPADFSLMDFVKRLRHENEQILEEYKHELREQLVSTLKDEAGGILKSFAAAMLESRRDLAQQEQAEAMKAITARQHQKLMMGGVGASRSKSKRMGRASSPEVLQHRVALNILQSMTATLGQEQVAKALGARPSRRHLSSAPASSTASSDGSDMHTPPPAPAPLARLGSAAGGPRRAAPKAGPEDQRITSYLHASPFYPAQQVDVEGNEGSTNNRRPMTTPVQSSSGQALPIGDHHQHPYAADGVDDGDGAVPKQSSRTSDLLSKSQQLLGDPTVMMARAATAIGSSRRGLLLPTVLEKRPGTAFDINQQQDPPSSSHASSFPSPWHSVAAGATGEAPAPSSSTKRTRSARQAAPLPSAAGSGGSQAPGRRARPAVADGGTSRPRPSTTMATGRPSSRHPPTMPQLLRGTTTIRKAGDVLPQKLGDEEWENEVARNILTLYVSSVQDQSHTAPTGMGSTHMINHGPAPVITATTSTTMAVEKSLAYGSANKRRRPYTTPATLRPPRLGTSQQQQRPPFNQQQQQPGSTPSSGSKHHVPRTIPSLGHYRIPVMRRNGSESFVMIPRIPQTIWFAGTGTNRADWSSVPGATKSWLMQLQALDGQGAYAKYLVLTEALLVTAMRACDTFIVPPHLRLLWRQLVVTANNFGVRAIEAGRYALALDLLQKAGELCDSNQQGGGGAILVKRTRRELHAFIMDSYGFYYYKRHKFNAALCYVQRAMRIHAGHRNWAHVAACHLHSSCVLAKMEGKVPEGLRCMSQVLAMVEDGKLDVGGPTTQKVALVAVCYHNMAALYLTMRNLGEAFMCSQNARRLSRLSLAYSSRWADRFERTHKVVLSEIAAKYKYVDRIFRDKDQEYLFSALLTAL